MSTQESGWGGWTLDRERLVLENKHYEVDLERALTGAQLCDWIFQVRQHSWASPEVIAGLLSAFEDLLHPQANLCSGGENKEISTGQLEKLVQELS